jgi:hypothetical protein
MWPWQSKKSLLRNIPELRKRLTGEYRIRRRVDTYWIETKDFYWWSSIKKWSEFGNYRMEFTSLAAAKSEIEDRVTRCINDLKFDERYQSENYVYYPMEYREEKFND